MAATSQASADKYDQYADFFVSIESDPYLQTSHWQTVAQARHDSLTARAAASEAIADSYTSTASSMTSQANTNETNSDTRYAQIMASAQAQLDWLAALRSIKGTGSHSANKECGEHASQEAANLLAAAAGRANSGKVEPGPFFFFFF